MDNDSKNIVKNFDNISNDYWYDMYKKENPDYYTIHLDKNFDIHLIYNFDKIKSIKIVDLV
jgi:hypothetical protein